MSREEPLATGIGFLKTLLGTYIIIIASICYFGYKDPSEAKDPAPIESVQEDGYVVLSYNGKTFVMEASVYDAYMNSETEETVLVDALGQDSTQTVINKNDIQEINRCTTFDEAAQYANTQTARLGK